MRSSKFIGVYTTAASARRKQHYFVWELSDGTYAVQELDAAFTPVAEARLVEANTFSGIFRSEPSLLVMPVVLPDFTNLKPFAIGQHMVKAPGQTKRLEATTFFRREPAHAESSQADGQASPQPTSQSPALDKQAAAVRSYAEAVLAHRAFDLEAARKAKVLETHLRETFRQTLLRLKRPRERKAAMLALEKIAGTTEGIVPSHKHMFRDFGVRLRQNFQPALALLFNRKAVELAPEDDHARFNLARILCALGQYDEAAEHIRVAMDMDKKEPLYEKMLAHILALKQKGVAPQPMRRV